jgi:hypothetical protein
MLADVPFPWEDESRRQVLPETLAPAITPGSRVLLVPRSIVRKIHQTHPRDVECLDRLAELLDRWELVGLSPNSTDRLELYGQLDGVWHTAVIALASENAPYNVLITFHRVYARKVMSRERHGRLRRR